VTGAVPLERCVLDVAETGQPFFALSAGALAAAVTRPPTSGPGDTPQDLAFTGPVAGQATAATTGCSTSPSVGRFSADLVARVGGRQVDLVLIVLTSYHGAGAYPVGGILAGAGTITLDVDSGSFVAASSDGAGTLTVAGDGRSGAVDADLGDGEHVRGTWRCASVDG
jgi:hypothetical protein